MLIICHLQPHMAAEDGVTSKCMCQCVNVAEMCHSVSLYLLVCLSRFSLVILEMSNTDNFILFYFIKRVQNKKTNGRQETCIQEQLSL